MARPTELFTAFVGNLACSVTRVQLLDVFEPYGNLHSVYVRVPDPSATHTFGFVRFTNPESRDAAVEAQNGRPLLGHYMSVQKSHHTAQRSTNQEGTKLDAGRKSVRDRADENGAADVARLDAVDASIQMHRLQQVKDSYAKVLATKHGVHGAAADSMVADFIEHLSRIPYGVIDVDDLVTSLTTRLDTGLTQMQLSKLKQHEQQPQQPVEDAGSEPEIASGMAESMQPLLLLTPSSSSATSQDEPEAPCQQQQLQQQQLQQQLPSAPVSAAAASADRDGHNGGGSPVAAAAATLKPQATRMGVLCSSSATFEPKGRGKASIEFLEECTGRGRLHAKV